MSISTITDKDGRKCLKSDKYNSIISESLFNSIQEKDPSVTDLEIFLEKTKPIIIVECITFDIMTNEDGRRINDITICSGRVYKTDELNKFNIDDRVYFLQTDMMSYNNINSRCILYPDKAYLNEQDLIKTYIENNSTKLPEIKVDHIKTEKPVEIVKPVEIDSSKFNFDVSPTVEENKEVEVEIETEDIPVVDSTSSIIVNIDNSTKIMSKFINKNMDMFIKDPECYIMAFGNFYIDYYMINHLKTLVSSTLNLKKLMKAYYFTKYLMSKTHYNEVRNKVSNKYGIDPDVVKDWIAKINSYRGHSKVKIK